MKKPHGPPKPSAPSTPLDPKQFPLKAQTPSSASRDRVREEVPVHAPRQSKRPIERSK